MARQSGWALFADEYSGDAGQTDYEEYARHAAAIAQKCGEGAGPYSAYPAMRAGARAAGLVTIAYFWVLMREDGPAQATAHVANALDAEAFAVDLESGRTGTHSSNVGASKATILQVMHAYFDRFHELVPTRPLLLYGASYMGNEHITWAELVGTRDFIYAWLPRYSGAGDIRGWARERIVSYAARERYDVPAERIAAVQFTDGTFGPQPHTLPGLNRNEDISVLLVPLEQLSAEEDDMTKEQAEQLAHTAAFINGYVKELELDPAKRGTYDKAGRHLARAAKRDLNAGKTR